MDDLIKQLDKKSYVIVKINDDDDDDDPKLILKLLFFGANGVNKLYYEKMILYFQCLMPIHHINNLKGLSHG